MTTPKALLTMGRSTSIMQPLLPGIGQYRLFHSFGEEIPDLRGFDVSYWMGGLWAQRLRLLGYATDLCSPGVAWLPSVGEELAGRQVFNGRLSAVPDTDTPLWAKPAEAKLTAFPVGAYTLTDLERLFRAENIQPDLELQWTESILNLNCEHRFFVLDGQIVTGSPYVMRGISDAWSQYEAAEKFARFALRELGENHPPHFTLDVALNTDTGRWLIVEGNRAWSSGVYFCDPALALAAIDASSHWAERVWQWQPDEQIITNSQQLSPLREIGIDVDAVGFIEYQGDV